GHSKVFGQAFFKKVAGHGVEPRSAAKRQGKRPAERGRRPRIRGGSAHSAPAPARYNKVFDQTFFKKLAGVGAEPPECREAAGKTASREGAKAPNLRWKRAHSPGSRRTQ